MASNGNLKRMFSNTSEFRTEALHFQEFGIYTKEAIGSKSWYNYWKEMRRRSLEGHKQADGTWITGYHWHMLNFCPIMQTEIVNENQNEELQNQAKRIKNFPLFLDGQVKMFHYLEEAELYGEHAGMLGKRGAGKSIIGGSMCARNYHHIPDSNSYCFAATEEYLTNDGIITKCWDFIDHIDNTTPWSKRRHEENSSLHRKASTKIINAAGVATVDPRSFNSQVIGVTVGDNIDKLRGKRGKLIILEEWGNFPRLKKGFNILRPSMESGRNTFGMIFGIGTGGTEGAAFDGVEELFKNPKAYRIHAINNVWDAGMETSECAFFYPASWNFEGAMDEDGNSDIEKATRLINLDRKLVSTGSDPHALVRRCAEIPLTPQEAMMRISGTQFPILELKRQEAELETKPHLYRDAEFHVTFELDRETQKYVPVTDGNATPIYSFPHLDNKNMKGCFIIYEHPQVDNKGEVYYNRYVAGGDSYDFDESGTTSLGAFYIADLWTKRVVAEYVGRPPRAFDFYEMCRRGLLYYNAIANFENANNGIFRYFEDKNCYHLMCDELRISREANPENTTAKNRPKGTTPGKLLNAYARGLLSQMWLEKTGNPDKPEELRIHRFRSIAAIREAVLWNIDGNFDRISALMMLVLIMYDREKYVTDGTIDLQDSIINDPWLQSLLPKHLQKSQSLLLPGK